MDVQNAYKDSVHRALERCQFIEETLRVYLDLATQIAKIELKSHFPVNITKKNLSKLSLGRLVEKFSQFNGNTLLKDNLRKVVPDRNRVAHQSLLFTLGEIQDDTYLRNLTDEMNEIEKQARNVHETLLDERWKLQKSLRAIRRKDKGSDKKGN